MEYFILKSSSATDLQGKVQSALDNGYKLYGYLNHTAVCSAFGIICEEWSQAVIKDSK